MSESTLLSTTGKLTREKLALVPTPPGTATHKTIPHVEVVNALVETLGFRHIGVVREEYAISKDGMKLFGALDLETTFHGCRFSIRLACLVDALLRGKALQRGGLVRIPADWNWNVEKSKRPPRSHIAEVSAGVGQGSPRRFQARFYVAIR